MTDYSGGEGGEAGALFSKRDDYLTTYGGCWFFSLVSEKCQQTSIIGFLVTFLSFCHVYNESVGSGDVMSSIIFCSIAELGLV